MDIRRIRFLPISLAGLALACNLAAPTPSQEGSAPVSNPPGEMQIEILTPVSGAILPAGVPVLVRFRVTGGEAIEAWLTVDGEAAAAPISPIASGIEYSITWNFPAPGGHTLAVHILDALKADWSAQIPVTIAAGEGSAANPPPAEPAPSGPSVAFTSAADGAELAAWTDSTGMPFVSVTAQAAGGEIRDLALDANGLQVARAHNDAHSDPFSAEFAWTPYLGNGEYRLTVSARTADANENHFSTAAQATILVRVIGLPDGAPSLRQRISQLYLDRFGQSVPVPPLARYIKPNPSALDPSRWVSVAYVEDHLYEINLFDDGAVTTVISPISHADPAQGDSICRPAGDLNLLVYFVDYGNTGVSPDQAFASIADATVRANAWHEAYAARLGLAAPLLRLRTTPAYAGPPVRAGDFLSAAEIRERTGYSTNDFDLTAQVDLDSGAAVAARFHGLGLASFGGCLPGGSERVNLFLTIQSAGTLTDDLYGSLLIHELAHDLGWMHWWPTGDGSAGEQMIWNYDNPAYAALFFGWLDVDGDGLVEILDPLPYGW